MSNYYTIGDALDVRIEKIVPRGFGLAFAEQLTLMVPLAAPGDLLRVKIVELKKRLAWAEIVEVLRPGPARITPPCPYFGSCGGCNFQQMDYPAQLAAKVGIVRDCLSRLGKIEFNDEIPIVPSPAEFEYRARAGWHIDRQTREIGYFRRDSHAVIDIERCPIVRPVLNATLGELRSEISWDSFYSEQFDVSVAEGDSGAVSMFSGEFAEPAAEISARLAAETYFYNAEVFFQANRPLIGTLVETAIGTARGDVAIDLYSGVGLFSLPLARRFNKVIGIEENSTSVSFAKKSAANAGLDGIDFQNRSVSAFLAKSSIREPAFVLIDPPRIGTERGVIESLAAMRPERIAYVSCEPSILARDLRSLIDGGYTIDSVTALDMFPQTHHVETVAHLSAYDPRTIGSQHSLE